MFHFDREKQLQFEVLARVGSATFCRLARRVARLLRDGYLSNLIASAVSVRVGRAGVLLRHFDFVTRRL